MNKILISISLMILTQTVSALEIQYSVNFKHGKPEKELYLSLSKGMIAYEYKASIRTEPGLHTLTFPDELGPYKTVLFSGSGEGKGPNVLCTDKQGKFLIYPHFPLKLALSVEREGNQWIYQCKEAEH